MHHSSERIPAVSPIAERWPELRVSDWEETRDTLHLWTQVVGKVRMAHEPMLNHWWQVTLYVTPRGLSTSAIPGSDGTFELEFDFNEHVLRITAEGGRERSVPLASKTVAEFYFETLAALADLGIDAGIEHPLPNEVDPAIPFAEDFEHSSYDAEAAHAFWRQLVDADRVMKRFRAGYAGKVSPVHFFWGAMDMAVTRFSGRPAPRHPGGAPNCGDWVMVEGYSHELSSCGFWPGGGEEGAFYAYTYPEPDGYREHPVATEGAFYSDANRQWLLPYEAVRTAPDPDAALLRFFQDTYEAGAINAGWDREALEYRPVEGARPSAAV